MTTEQNRWVHSLNTREIHLGLSRVRGLLTALGSPQRGLPCVHVAGTNGKGSTSACIASILQAAGYRVGLFTSPALERPEERIQVNGVPIPEDCCAQLSAELCRAAESLTEAPTEFEAITAMALLYFRRAACDLAVLEVGLGGGGDATNVIDPPEVAVLTAMALDHTGLLGNTLTEIAIQKAGILKSASCAVSYGNEPDCNQVFQARCRALNCSLTEMDRGRLSHCTTGLHGCSVQLSPYGNIHLPLLGAYQAENALLAVTAAEALRGRGWRISDEAIRRGLEQVRWPGRCELLWAEPPVLLDGSHNPQGLRATLETLKQLLPGKRPVLLVSFMADKEVETMAKQLTGFAQDFVAVRANNPRAMDENALGALLCRHGGNVTVCSSILEGVRAALTVAKVRGTEGAVCALGTLYFSAQVRQAVLALTGKGDCA